MKKTKTQNGITLIALIITIIVLLILAVVAISAVQDDGIINYAKNARGEYEKAQGEENTTLQNYLDKLKENVPTTSSEGKDQTLSSDYGKAITYSAGGVTDWKVFYKDNTYWYIITSDHLENTKLPEGLKMTKFLNYGAYWNSKDDFISTDSSVISSEVAGKYQLSWLPDEKTTNNARATADLLNVDVWTAKFGNKDKGIEAIGGPTLQMWVASWNAKGYTKLYVGHNDTGYYIGKSQNSTSDDIDVTSDPKGYGDKLYFPYQNQNQTQNNSVGYYLASPGASSFDSVKGIHWEFGIRDISTAWIGGSLRPVVSIPADLITTDADGSLAVAQ